jgi:high-affinity Fe2+/Pb2+ permease
MATRWKRLAWFVGLWCAGVLTVTLLAYGIRLAMGIH